MDVNSKGKFFKSWNFLVDYVELQVAFLEDSNRFMFLVNFRLMSCFFTF